MNHYEPSTPRFAVGIAAVAMTAITIGVAVVMPAKMDLGGRELRVLAASKVTTPTSTSLAAVTSIDVVAAREPGSSTSPATVTRIDVFAAREPGSSTEACDPAKPNHRSES